MVFWNWPWSWPCCWGLRRFFADVSLCGNGFAGSAILLWMALGMFRSLPTLRLAWDREEKKQNHLMISGILMSVGQSLLDHLVGDDRSRVYPLFLAVRPLGCRFFFCRSYSCGTWLGMQSFAAAVARGRHFLTDRLYRGLIAGCAVFLVFFSCYFCLMPGFRGGWPDGGLRKIFP